MKWLSFIFIILIVAQLPAQKYKPYEYKQSKFNVSGSYYWGTIVKHNSKFGPDITQKSHGFELSFSKITKGNKAWQRKLNYPEIGGALFMARFGDNEIFGNAIGAFPYAKIWILRRKVVDWYFRMGIGLAYLNKPYHVIDNPTNNVIGSKINNITQLSMGFDFKIRPELSLFTGLNFTHFSNASFQTPNLGINYVAFSTGFRYNPKPQLGGYNTDEIPKPKQKNFAKLAYSMAFYEYRTPNGPKYPVIEFTGAYARATSIVNRVFGGVYYAFDMGRLEYMHLFGYEYKNREAHMLGFFVGDELFLGRVSLDAYVGVYAMKLFEDKTPIFAKLGLNYHAVKFGETKEKSFFISAHMKTHYFVAQYFDVGIGVNL